MPTEAVTGPPWHAIVRATLQHRFARLVVIGSPITNRFMRGMDTG